MLVAITQSNLLGGVFGSMIASIDEKASSSGAVVLFIVWAAASWYVWLWARRKFWPEDYA